MSIEKLIDDLVTQAGKTPASILVQRALTVGGCIPEEDKLAPLTSAERYAIECITSKTASRAMVNLVWLSGLMGDCMFCRERTLKFTLSFLD